MVVIIDDRADVWEWSPNLIKVIPCECHLSQPRAKLTLRVDDFFVGIGDINSSFLAKITPLTPSSTATSPQQPGSPSGEPFLPSLSSTLNGTDIENTGEDLSDSSEPLTPEAIETAEFQNKILLSTNAAALEEQFEQRPLAKKQEELEGVASHDTTSTSSQESSSDNQSADGQKSAESPAVIPTHHPEKPKHALLKNDDIELERIGKVCFLMWGSMIHSEC
jgi:RNA polymerase II subunit A-like phosphatase